MPDNTLHDIPGSSRTAGPSYGTAPAVHAPAAMVASGLYAVSPTSLRPDGSRPRHLFDMATEEGRKARDAFAADLERRKTGKADAYARYMASLGVGEGMHGDGI